MALRFWPTTARCAIGRRERALAQMDEHDLDVLVLGRQANVRYVSGAPQLWVAGTRPFGPTCVVVRETGAIHLLSTWDEGVPEDIPHENLYGISWNPMNTISVLKGIDGAADAETGWDRRTFAGFCAAAAGCLPERRAGRRRAGDARGAPDQDGRRSVGAAGSHPGRRGSAWPRRSPSCGPESAKRRWPVCCWRRWRPAA